MPSLEQYRAGYLDLWGKADVTKPVETRQQVAKVLKYRATYEDLERATGVPWFCIAIIHLREAGLADVGRWECTLHNGERIIGKGRKTTLVPKGKGPFKTFKEAAVDALSGYDNQTWDVPLLAYTLEKFNGFGYRKKGIPSPYLWGGTSVQQKGKYVRDGVYDPSTLDPQIGGMALLKIMETENSITFAGTKKPVEASPPEPQPSPTVETQKAPVPESTKAAATGGLVGVLLSWMHAHMWQIAAGVVIGVALYICGRVAYDVWQEKRQQKTVMSPKTE